MNAAAFVININKESMIIHKMSSPNLLYLYDSNPITEVSHYSALLGLIFMRVTHLTT